MRATLPSGLATIRRGRSSAAGNPDDGLTGLDSRDDVCYFPQVEALDAMHARASERHNRAQPPFPTDAWLGVGPTSGTTSASASRTATSRDSRRARVRPGRRVTRACARSSSRTSVSVREFVAAHPSHRLVEVAFVIDDPGAGDVLETAFGISARCWGRENVNPKDKGVAALSRFRGCDFGRDASGGERRGSPVISHRSVTREDGRERYYQ